MPGVNILSIQSLVSYGHAGNSAAMFPLQRLGFDVWPVVTVHFSNHTGYGAARGPLLTAEDIAEVIRGVEDRGALDRCDAVLSGYQGAEDVGAVILAALLGRRLGIDSSEAFWLGLFHSISAFCNAGFVVFRDSMVGAQTSELALLRPSQAPPIRTTPRTGGNTWTRGISRRPRTFARRTTASAHATAQPGRCDPRAAERAM